jgi:hypothetical protein
MLDYGGGDECPSATMGFARRKMESKGRRLRIVLRMSHFVGITYSPFRPELSKLFAIAG